MIKIKVIEDSEYNTPISKARVYLIKLEDQNKENYQEAILNELTSEDGVVELNTSIAHGIEMLFRVRCSDPFYLPYEEIFIVDEGGDINKIVNLKKDWEYRKENIRSNILQRSVSFWKKITKEQDNGPFEGDYN